MIRQVGMTITASNSCIELHKIPKKNVLDNES